MYILFNIWKISTWDHFDFNVWISASYYFQNEDINKEAKYYRCKRVMSTKWPHWICIIGCYKHLVVPAGKVFNFYILEILTSLKFHKFIKTMLSGYNIFWFHSTQKAIAILKIKHWWLQNCASRNKMYSLVEWTPSC